MRRMRRMWTALTATVVLAAMGLVAGPARAFADKPARHWLTCEDGAPPQKGQLDVTVFDDGPGPMGEHTYFLKLGGWLEMCAEPGPDDAYALVQFAGPVDTPAYYYRLPFDSGTGLETFQQSIEPKRPDLRALCLSTREGPSAEDWSRIDCVSVTWTPDDAEQQRPPTVGPHIPSTAAILQRPANHTIPARPSCNGCWDE